MSQGLFYALKRIVTIVTNSTLVNDRYDGPTKTKIKALWQLSVYTEHDAELLRHRQASHIESS